MTKRKAVLLSAGLVVAALGYSSCRGPSHSEIEEEMEYWLGGDVPSDFRIAESSYSFAVSDDINSARIDFTPAAYDDLLNSIDPSLADTLRAGRQVHLRDESRERFNNYFLLGVYNSDEQVLRLQFGHE